jgi:hypothetical protein
VADPAAWLAELASALGQPPPTQDEIDDLLALASTAAHASERWAAPLACWLVGRAGTAPSEARSAAESIAI